MPKWIYKSTSDEALMVKYAKGQADAFECLYLRHKDRLFSFIRRQCNNRAVSEELAHDTWIAVINQAGSYQPRAKFVTWIFRIAHNRLIDYWRKHGNNERGLIAEVSEQLASVEDKSLQGIEFDQLVESLRDLSEVQVEALLLKIEGFSHSEIAEITQTKRETVKSRLRYATKHLRVAMEVVS